MAVLIGIGLAGAAFGVGCAVLAAWNGAQCRGEYRPFLGSARQAFVVYGCLARDAGPLIALKKRLGIYDPTWKTVIK